MIYLPKTFSSIGQLVVDRLYQYLFPSERAT